MKTKPTIDIDTVIRMYTVELKSCKVIADSFGCVAEVIRRRLIKAGVAMRPVGPIYPMGRKFGISEEDLRREYVDNGRTQEQVAELFGCGSTLIYSLMQRYGIEARDRGELLKGRKFSHEHRENLSKAKAGTQRGEKSPSWKGGRTIDHVVIRKQAEHQRWRKFVLRIKGNVCESCGKDLLQGCSCCGHVPDRHVHHIKPFADHPELRFSVDNALVLCESCHMSLHFKKGTD